MHRAAVAILFSATLSVACGRDAPEPAAGDQRPAASGTPTADIRTLAKHDGQWVMAPKDYAATRFSGLTEITTDNVKNLPTV